MQVTWRHTKLSKPSAVLQQLLSSSMLHSLLQLVRPPLLPWPKLKHHSHFV